MTWKILNRKIQASGLLLNGQISQDLNKSDLTRETVGVNLCTEFM